MTIRRADRQLLLIALLADGSFLLAHLGADVGGVFRLQPDGEIEPFLSNSGTGSCRSTALA